jgi:hypothetical protein
VPSYQTGMELGGRGRPVSASCIIWFQEVIRIEPTRVRWTPSSDEDRKTVREAMEKVLASNQFCNSRRYPALLRYVVDQALSGNGDQIKERTVGIEVFGRPPDYDTNTDTVVRYTAGEVRKRLALFYQAAPDAPVQISLSARSYLPEFHRLADFTGADGLSRPQNGNDLDAREHVPTSPDDALVRHALRHQRRRIFALVLCVAFGASSVLGVLWAWKEHRSQSMNRFWSPMIGTRGPVLISAGSILFSTDSKIGTQVGDNLQDNSYLSFENGLAMGRVAALVNARNADYRIQSATETTLAQIRESPTVLVGAYNNLWSQRLLAPLRFHFNVRSDEAILDSLHPEKRWARDASKPFTQTPDYAIVARFRNPSTDSFVVVLAGLQRFGTDAASRFAVSSRLLDTFNKQVGYNWTDKNIEVVLRVDVIDGKAGAPIIEATHIW